MKNYSHRNKENMKKKYSKSNSIKYFKKLIILIIILIIIYIFIILNKNLNKNKQSKITKNPNILTYLNGYSREDDWINLNEFSEHSYQILKFLIPSDECKIKQNTIYFDINNMKNNTINSRLTIKNITNKNEYFLANILNNDNINLKNVLINNNIILTNEFSLSHFKENKIGSNILKNNNKDKFRYILYETQNNITNFIINYNQMKNKYKYYFNFLPNTYIIQNNDELIKNKFNNYKISSENMSSLWIYKNHNNYENNLFFINNINFLPNSGILMEYITNPLLINNKKFKMNIFILVTGIFPFKIYLFNDGYIKISLEEYYLSDSELNNTNLHFIKTNKNYSYKVSEFDYLNEQLWTISKYKNYLKNYNIKFDLIWDQIKDIAIKSIICNFNNNYYQDNINFINSKKAFQIFSLNILIDTNYKPWLLNINSNPNLDIDSYMKDSLSKQIIVDALNIVGLTQFNINQKIINDKNNLFNKYFYQNQNNIEYDLCEFKRPTGNFERIFPLKTNIKKYMKLINKHNINKELFSKIINENKVNSNKNVINNKNIFFNNLIKRRKKKHIFNI